MLLTSLNTFGIIAVVAHAQSDSSYLDTLKDEASDLQLDKSTKIHAGKPVGGLPGNRSVAEPGQNRAGGIEEIRTGLSLADFEDLLEHNYMGSYLFYKRLNAPQRQAVYEFYLKNPDPQEIRQQILRAKKRL